ncbi:unnamed protein product [Peronospora destructor]|uniref:TPX2 central domain-containing protein n=1 Tax=Peronospora destructor TaxID=86335 RepID=A0AAV0UCV5_9STRA|nr:unnamed protein product [Peronospora destructor]
MSTSPQKDDVAQDILHQPEQEQEKKIQDTEMEADNPNKENNVLATTEEEQETIKEENVGTAPKGTVTILGNTATPKTSTETSQSSTKRKFDALDACISESFNNEHPPKTKKDCAKTKLMKVSATKKINQSTTKTREFSFARATESSARRTAALTENHTKNMKTTPPSFKLQQLKRTPAKGQCASTPIVKTPTGTGAADKASRSHFSYTPYTGRLPPLTVESSFAPKSGQISDLRAWSASPAQTKRTVDARKPQLASAKEIQVQSTTGKENSGVNTKKKTATNAASSSQTLVTPGKKTGLLVSKEENWSSFKENEEAQRSLAQQARSMNPVPSSAAALEPTV